MRIAVTGYAGYGGSRLIYEDPVLRSRILMRYNESFFDIFNEPEESGGRARPMLCDADGRIYSHDPAWSADGSDGGVLAALWSLLKAHGLGGYYSLGAIPILQQTVEISEFLGLNPYRLWSPGLGVWLVGDESPIDFAELRKRAEGCGIPAEIIGYTAGTGAIRRIDTDTDSSLRRPGPDELRSVSGD